MKLLRKIIGFPFALIWDLIATIRNFLYDRNILSGQTFDLPVIGVGNLVMGGTGKTPHIEYLLKTLEGKEKAGVLSRGYKRKTSGYIFASTQSTVKQIGDEPLQFKLKHPHIPVAVSENRVLGIPQLLMDAPEISVILLDDVFQHRAVKPGLNILLTDYQNPYFDDMVFPSGNLRESNRGRKRADIIILTKCPADLSTQEAKEIKKKLKAQNHQNVYFSYFHYGRPYSFLKRGTVLEDVDDLEILIVTGIAKPEYLKNYLNHRYKKAFLFDFEDHHAFSERDVYQMAEAFQNLGNTSKAIFITEKDAVKLISFSKLFHELNLPVYVQPVEVGILFQQGGQLNEEVLNFVQNFHNANTARADK